MSAWLVKIQAQGETVDETGITESSVYFQFSGEFQPGVLCSLASSTFTVFRCPIVIGLVVCASVFIGLHDLS